MEAYVYVIEAKGSRIKVGSSFSPERRKSGLLSGSPEKLSVFGHVRCRDRQHAFSVERVARRHMRPLRVHNEWFDCCAYQAVQIIKMVRDNSDPDIIRKHVECQRLYNIPDDRGEASAEALELELKAMGHWLATGLDQYRAWRKGGMPEPQPDFEARPVTA